MESVSCQSRMHRAERFDKQIKDELAQEEARKQYVPRCPTCHSPDVEKIGTGTKLVDVAILGWASRKPGKQFKCKSCGYEW